MNTEKNEMILAISKGFGLNEKDAEDLFFFGETLKPEKVKSKATSSKTSKGKSKITDDELTSFEKILRTEFAGKEITNKMVSPRVSAELSLTAQQTPSRLKELEKRGVLEYVEGSKPRAYIILDKGAEG